jgi:hypothetical protein
VGLAIVMAGASIQVLFGRSLGGEPVCALFFLHYS